MAAKIFAIVCGLAVFAQVTSAQCLGALNPFGGPIPDAFPLPGSGIPFGQYGPACGAHTGVNGISLSNLGASYGGGLAVTSSSPISPTGLRVTSENAIEGALAIIGNLPFLGTVAVEGLYPTAGAGAVSYGCGNGVVGITSENIPSAPLTHAIAPTAVSQAGFSSFAPGLGYQGYIGVPRGCGSIY